MGSRLLPDVSCRWELSSMQSVRPCPRPLHGVVNFYVTRKERMSWQDSRGREVQFGEHSGPRSHHCLSLPLTLCCQLRASVEAYLADLGMVPTRHPIVEAILSFVHGVVGGSVITREFEISVNLEFISLEVSQDLVRGKVLKLWRINSNSNSMDQGTLDVFLSRKRLVSTADEDILEMSDVEHDQGTERSSSVAVPLALLSQPQQLLQTHIESSLASLNVEPVSMRNISQAVTSYITQDDAAAAAFHVGVDLEIREVKVVRGRVSTCKTSGLVSCDLCKGDLWSGDRKSQWVRKTPCAHVFHSSCLTSPFCPLCRA